MTKEEMEKLLPLLLMPSKEVIDAGETTLQDEQDSGWDSGPDGESHNSYTYFTSGTAGAALNIYRSMIKEFALRHGVSEETIALAEKIEERKRA